MKVGLLGAGHVADQYVAGMAPFPELELVAVADRDREVGRQRAGEWNVRAVSPAELLADEKVDLVVNLTPPRAHAETTRAALVAGKHVYSEKPLAVDVEEGRELVQLAARFGLGLGCAPDTFLGSAIETARDAVLAGAIGTPVAAHAFVGNPGPASWHPAPAAYYEPGAGPLFSLGPYYLTALVELLGPIEEAIGISYPSRAQRAVVDTTSCGALRFAEGAIATLFASYEVEAARVPPLEIYGTAASLSLPDPDFFDGPVLLGRQTGWVALEVGHPIGLGRGVGVAQLVLAIASDRLPRASGSLALHVLDAMCAIRDGGRRLTTTLPAADRCRTPHARRAASRVPGSSSAP